MKLVAAVTDALPVLPADRVELGRAERLRDQHVVVDRHDVVRDRAQQRRVCACRKQDAAGAHTAGSGEHLDHGPRVPQVVDRGVLEHAHPDADRGVTQPGSELARIEDAGAGVVPDAAEIRGGRDLRAHRRAVEHGHLVTEALQRFALLLEPRLLVGVSEREQLAGGLEVAIDAMALEVGAQPGEVLQAEPLEHVHLLGEARQPVLDPVRE